MNDIHMSAKNIKSIPEDDYNQKQVVHKQSIHEKEEGS